MYYVAMINETDHEVQYAESYETHAEAVERVRMGLGPQAELNAAGFGTCEAGKVWRVYLGETPFEWPAPAPVEDAPDA